MSTEITLYHAARTELQQILDAGARALKPAGLELMPIKREMLIGLLDHERDLIMDCLNLLFASCLSYEGAQWAIDHAANPIDLVTARLEAGRAEGVVQALFFGPTVQLILYAMHAAPIAFYALSETAPNLHLIDRCKLALKKQ
jgi:hypothetical protein